MHSTDARGHATLDREHEPGRLKVSVIVPVRDEERSLPVLLRSLFAQTHPPDEILVADGGSQDQTASLAEAEATRGVRVLRLGPAYPGRGRNQGALAARNDWLAFIDAGCEAGPEWLEALESAVRAEDGPSVVFGSFQVTLPDEWARAQALTYVAPEDPVTGCRPPSIASALVHRAAWEAAGRFREDLRAAEDLLFFEGLDAARVPRRQAPRAIVTWELAAGPAAMFRRFRRYSAHHLAAGLSRTWHRRVLAMDAAALGLFLVGFWAPAAWLLLAAAGGARLLRTIFVRRANILPHAAFRPDRILRVALLLFLADLALVLGTIDHLRGHRAAPPP
jgi:glycosyltransferase involved in cell wall biosynthesis